MGSGAVGRGGEDACSDCWADAVGSEGGKGVAPSACSEAMSWSLEGAAAARGAGGVGGEELPSFCLRRFGGLSAATSSVFRLRASAVESALSLVWGGDLTPRAVRVGGEVFLVTVTVPAVADWTSGWIDCQLREGELIALRGVPHASWAHLASDPPSSSSCPH